MEARLALLVGAGISAAPPASLPLGQELEERLRRCYFEAAARIAPGAVDEEGLAAVARMRRSLIAPLAACAGTPVAVELLRCFRVAVPSEAQLTAALHAMRGALLLTLNFDDGIECADALLRGECDLDGDAPDAYRRALDEWRRAVPTAPPLRIVASRLDTVDFAERPLLVKLRGSADAGWHHGLVPVDGAWPVETGVLTADQEPALHHAAAADHLVVAGVSGADLDCRDTLLPLLRRGRFAWTAAALDGAMVAALRRIDPQQPVLRPSLHGLRAALPDADTLPHWPRDPAGRLGFEARWAEWTARLPVAAAAEIYARLLWEAGMPRQAEAVMLALAA